MKMICVCGREIPVELTGAYLTIGQNVRCIDCFREYNIRVVEIP
jgi:hypothetical protein